MSNLRLKESVFERLRYAYENCKPITFSPDDLFRLKDHLGERLKVMAHRYETIPPSQSAIIALLNLAKEGSARTDFCLSSEGVAEMMSYLRNDVDTIIWKYDVWRERLGALMLDDEGADS